MYFFQTHECIIEKIPFRGAPCSDAAGRQVPYKTIMTQVNSSLSGILWDEEQKASYLEYKVSCLFIWNIILISLLHQTYKIAMLIY